MPATATAPAPSAAQMASARSETQADENPASDAEPDGGDERTRLADEAGVEVELEQGTELDARIRQGSEREAEMEEEREREREREAQEERERERRLKIDVRRYYALAELVDTERAYVRDLRALVEVYLSSLGAPSRSPAFNEFTPDSASPSRSTTGLPPTASDSAAQLNAKKARRRSQPLPSRDYASPVGFPGAAARVTSSTSTDVGGGSAKEMRRRRMSLGTLSIGRGPLRPSTPPPSDTTAGASHYIPHSQTPAGRASAESTQAVHEHVQAVAHRRSLDAPAKLQKKSRPDHARSQSASSMASFTVGFAPGLNAGFGGVVPPSSFVPHRGRMSVDSDSRSASGRRWTPSPSPSRSNSFPLLSTSGATGPYSTLAESASTLKPGFLQSAHALGVTLGLSEAEGHVLARSAAEILRLHEYLVRKVDDALRQVHFDLPDSAENVEEAVKVVCRIFSTEAKKGSFKPYEAFCAGHTEALDAVRHVSRSKSSEWAEWERRCKSEAAVLIIGQGTPGPMVVAQMTDEPEQQPETSRRMGFELTSTSISLNDDAPLVPPDRAALLGLHVARSSTSTLRERRRHSASASTLEHELGLGSKASLGSLRTGKSTALKHTKSDPTSSGEKSAGGTPQRKASRASLFIMSSSRGEEKMRFPNGSDANAGSPSRPSFGHERDSERERERQALMKLNFADYLIKPIQRVCKYPLLFEQLRTLGWRKQADGGQKSGGLRAGKRAEKSGFPVGAERRQSKASFTFAEDGNESDDEDGEASESDVEVVVEKTMLSMKEVTRAVDDARRKRDIEVKSRLIKERIISGNPNSPHVVLSMEGDGSADESSVGHSEFGHSYVPSVPHRPPTRSLSFSSAFSRSRTRVANLNHGVAEASEHGHGQRQSAVNVMGRWLLSGPPSRPFLDSLGACLFAGTLDVVVRDLSHTKARIEGSTTKRDSILSVASMASMASSASRNHNVITSSSRAHPSAGGVTFGGSQKDPVKVKYLAAFLYVGGYVLLAKTMKAGVYAARHWFSLADEGVEVVDVSEDEALLPCSFHLIFHATGHRLELAAACRREKLLWLQAITSARTVIPRWDCEPVPTLSVSAPTASMDISDTDVPPVPSVPSTLSEGYFQSVLPRASSSTLRTEVTVRPRGAGPDRRQSLTGSTVRALFAYGAGHGPDLAPPVPSTLLIRRVSAARRAQIDRLLADVLSEPLLAARLHAKAHDEVLFRDPEPLQGAALGMGAMAKNKLMGRESVIISAQCPKSAPSSTTVFPHEQRASVMSTSTSETGVLSRTSSSTLKQLSLKGKRSLSRRSFGMRLTLSNSLAEVDIGDSQTSSNAQSPASPESPLPMAAGLQESQPQSQAALESRHRPSLGGDDPPMVRVVGMDSPQPPTLELPDMLDPMNRPKRSRSLIDNVKGFFIPRSVSPSPSPTPSLALSASSKQPSSADNEAKETECLNVLARMWKSTSLRNRARSATEVRSRKNSGVVRKSSSAARQKRPAASSSAPPSRRASFLARSSSMLLSRRLSTVNSDLDPVVASSSAPSPSSSQPPSHDRASTSPEEELCQRTPSKRLTKRRLFPSDLVPLTPIHVETPK